MQFLEQNGAFGARDMFNDIQHEHQIKALLVLIAFHKLQRVRTDNLSHKRVLLEEPPGNGRSVLGKIHADHPASPLVQGVLDGLATTEPQFQHSLALEIKWCQESFVLAADAPFFKFLQPNNSKGSRVAGLVPAQEVGLGVLVLSISHIIIWKTVFGQSVVRGIPGPQQALRTLPGKLEKRSDRSRPRLMCTGQGKRWAKCKR